MRGMTWRAVSARPHLPRRLLLLLALVFLVVSLEPLLTLLVVGTDG